jgi:hypothetical protein
LLAALADVPAIQELIPTIVARRNSPEVYSTVRRAVGILKLSGPLRQQLADLLARLIEQVAAAFGITDLATDVTDPLERSLLDLAKFARLVYSARNEFNEYRVLKRSKLILPKIQELVRSLAQSCVATAVARGCDDDELARLVRQLLDDLAAHSENQTDDNYRRMLGSACQLPVFFPAKGRMSRPWAKAAALCDSGPLNELLRMTETPLRDLLKIEWPPGNASEISIETVGGFGKWRPPAAEDEGDAAKKGEKTSVKAEETVECSDSFSHSYSEDPFDGEDLEPEIIYDDVNSRSSSRSSTSRLRRRKSKSSGSHPKSEWRDSSKPRATRANG